MPQVRELEEVGCRLSADNVTLPGCDETITSDTLYIHYVNSFTVVSCRKNVRIVRDYIGATGKGPLVGAEKRFLKRAVADRVDPDSLDNYYGEVETFSQAIAKASSLSYTAGMSDLDSINTFSKGEEAALGDSSSLEQARKAIVEAKQAMDNAITILTESM